MWAEQLWSERRRKKQRYAGSDIAKSTLQKSTIGIGFPASSKLYLLHNKRVVVMSKICLELDFKLIGPWEMW